MLQALDVHNLTNNATPEFKHDKGGSGPWRALAGNTSRGRRSNLEGGSAPRLVDSNFRYANIRERKNSLSLIIAALSIKDRN